jgi:replicative DNA helicase
MSDEQNKPQDSIETTDELTDEELEQAAGGASWLEALAKAMGEAANKQAEAVQKAP